MHLNHCSVSIPKKSRIPPSEPGTTFVSSDCLNLPAQGLPDGHLHPCISSAAKPCFPRSRPQSGAPGKPSHSLRRKSPANAILSSKDRFSFAMAGLLTYRPSRPLRLPGLTTVCSVASGEISCFTVAGPCRIHTGFPINQTEASCCASCPDHGKMY